VVRIDQQKAKGKMPGGGAAAFVYYNVYRNMSIHYQRIETFFHWGWFSI